MALEITDANYQDLLEKGMPVVIDFWAPWCGPCKVIAPVMDELAVEYADAVIIGKCNVDENVDLLAEFGIRNIPTILFFKEGKMVDKQVSSAPKATFVAKIKGLL